MNTFSDLVLFAGIIGLVTSLAKPKIFDHFLNQNKISRRQLRFGFGAIIILALVILAVGTGSQKAAQATNSPHSAQQANTQALNSDLNANAGPTTSSLNVNTPTQATEKPTLRQDLAFQGDASFCDAVYKDNGNGTTTWTLSVKQAGELITHLSDKSGHIYRHDDKVDVGFSSYTAPVTIGDVSEINGNLYIGDDSHPCNISPAQS